MHGSRKSVVCLGFLVVTAAISSILLSVKRIGETTQNSSALVYITTTGAHEREKNLQQTLSLLSPGTTVRHEGVYMKRFPAMGCLLSHMSALRRVSEMNVKWAIIIENDVEVHNKTEVQHMLRELPAVLSMYPIVRLFYANQNRNDRMKPTSFAHYWQANKHLTSSVAYAITPSYAGTLARYLAAATPAALAEQLCRAQKESCSERLPYWAFEVDVLLAELGKIHNHVAWVMHDQPPTGSPNALKHAAGPSFIQSSSPTGRQGTRPTAHDIKRIHELTLWAGVFSS